MVVIRGRLAPEVGAVVMKALERRARRSISRRATFRGNRLFLR